MRSFFVARLSCLVGLPLVLLLSPPLLAEETGPLTLDWLWGELSRRSPELAGRRAEVRAAAERPAQARAFEDPMLMTELWQVPVNLTQVPLMFTLRQPIPWPGKLRARAAALLPEIDRAEAEAKSTLRGLRLEATRAYYNYSLAIHAADILRRSQELLRPMVASVDVRYRVGKAELADLLKAQEELERLDTTLIDLERERELAVTAINTLLARPADEPLGTPRTVPLPLPPLSLPTLTEEALRRRPELAASRAGIVAAQARRRSARVERAPDLSLWAGYMVMLRGVGDTFTLGVQTSIPSFTLSRDRAAEREAQAQADAQEATLAQTQARVRGEVREALLRVDTARRHVELLGNRLLPLSEQAFEAARASYQNGRVSLSLLLDAARAVVAHRLEKEQFMAEYGIRQAELEAAVGAPLADLSAGGRSDTAKGGTQ